MQDLPAQGFNPENHYLKFTLEGMPEPIVYRVSRETSERVARCFSAIDDFGLTAGVEFETLSGRMVNVSPRHVLMFHALWDYGGLRPEEEPGSDLVLYVRGVAEPQRSWDVELEELADIAFSIQHGGALSAFVSFADEDGEVLFVMGDRIMLMESADYSPFLEEEIAEYEAEAKEAEAKRKRRAKKAVKTETATSDAH